jgi:hypothetical protein
MFKWSALAVELWHLLNTKTSAEIRHVVELVGGTGRGRFLKITGCWLISTSMDESLFGIS